MCNCNARAQSSIYLRCEKFNAEKFQLNSKRGRNFSALNILSTKLFNDEIFGGLKYSCRHRFFQNFRSGLPKIVGLQRNNGAFCYKSYILLINLTQNLIIFYSDEIFRGRNFLPTKCFQSIGRNISE